MSEARERLPGHGAREAAVGGPFYPIEFAETGKVVVCLDGKELSHVIRASEKTNAVQVYEIDDNGDIQTAGKGDLMEAKRTFLYGQVELFLDGVESQHWPEEQRQQNTREAVKHNAIT